jgi:transposase-like protein
MDAMRIRMRLPEVDPEAFELPEECPYEGCHGQHFKSHQPECAKELLDPNHHHVTAKRYRCLRCKRTFRLYPRGVSRAQRSDRLRAIGVMFYVLGMSYGGVEDALEAFGWAGSKSSIYRDVQAAGEVIQRIRETQGTRKVQVAGADTTFVICNREQVTIAVGADALTQDVLDIELVESESVDALRPFVQELVRTFEVEVLLSDDQDTYKQLADELDIKHGLCRAHVNRNVAKLVEALSKQALKQPDPRPEGVHVDVDEFLEDLQYAQLIMAFRPLNGAEQLRELHHRYRAAPAPAPGERACMWYRFRLALLRWWNRWPRLTLDQEWRGPEGERLDGTNNVTERTIGWWIKERYRTMRTYKRPQSILNVSRLIAHLGSNSGSPALAHLYGV